METLYIAKAPDQICGLRAEFEVTRNALHLGRLLEAGYECFVVTGYKKIESVESFVVLEEALELDCKR